MNLLDHEMLISTLFCRCNIPIHMKDFLIYLLSQIIVEAHRISGYYCYLLIIQKINVSCMGKYGGNVRGNKVLTLASSYHQWAVLANCYQFIRVAPTYYSQRIGAL